MKLQTAIFAACFALSQAFLGSKRSPSQVHIALAGVDDVGNSNSMAVSYHTVDPTSSTKVKYGKTSGTYDAVATGSQVSYYETYHHHTVLGTLEPGTVYYYVVGNDVDGWSQEYRFKSAPTSSSLRGNYSFAVYGDLGLVNGQYSLNQLTSMKDSIEFVWHGGDVGYADDSFLHMGCAVRFCYEDAYNNYMQATEPWSSQIPYMVTPGNHEAECHDPSCLFHKERREKLSNFSAYNSRFRMPSPESGGIMNMHYSFNYGNAHFISIDTETGFPGAPEEKRYVLPCGGFGDQLNWLEADLKKANEDRATRPWIFVQGHHPMYQGDSINKELQAAMEDLFYKYGVDVFFNGHAHHYERNLPVYQGVPEPDYTNPRAPVHLLAGGAGCDEMHDIEPELRDPLGVDPNEVISPEGQGSWRPSSGSGAWMVFQDDGTHVGIGQVTVIDDSTLRYDYIRTQTGEVLDTITLTKDRSVKL